MDLKRMAEFWGAGLPLRVRRWSPTFAAALVDGQFLAAWPKVAAWAPAGALGLGFLIGALSPGYQFSLTESLVLLLFLTVLSLISGQLGALWLAGYIVGDFLIFRSIVDVTWGEGILFHIFRVRLPLVIYYTLLAVWAVQIPVIARTLVWQARWIRRGEGQIMNILAAALNGGLAGALVYFWAEAMPLLSRPIWTWHGNSPTYEAMQHLQEHTWLLVAVAAVVAAGRVLLEERARAQNSHAIGALAEQIAEAAPIEPMAARLPVRLQVALEAVFSTFLLSGMFLNWYEPLFFVILFIVLFALRAGLYLRLPGGWVDLVNRVPLLIRLVLAGVIGYLVSAQVTKAVWNVHSSTFLPILSATGLCLILMYLLCPEEAARAYRKPVEQQEVLR